MGCRARGSLSACPTLPPPAPCTCLLRALRLPRDVPPPAPAPHPCAYRVIAETGVQFISCGALTHSVKALDISLNIETQ